MIAISDQAKRYVNFATVPLDAYVNTSNKINYSEFVCSLFKTLDTPQQSLAHAAIGISGEAGELLDAIKKHWIYNKPLDRANVIEELGDLLFYMQALTAMLDIDLDSILFANYKKLEVRYKGLIYTDAAAIERADKKETGETK